MRVLLITALYPPAVGGAAIYFESIIPQLLRHDEIGQLIVLTEAMPGQPRESVEGKLRLLRHLPNRVSHLGRRCWLIHATTYMLTQLWFAIFLPHLVRRRGVDLIHFHTRYRGRLFYGALDRCHVPVIADLRDKMTDPARLMDVADRLLCCGEGVQHFAIEGGFPAERTLLIPNAFSPPEIPSPEQIFEVRRRYRLGEGPYLLFIGDITYKKGICELLEAYRRWRFDHPKVRLVLAGTNREGARFLSRIGRTAGVSYLGHVAHSDALVLIRGAEIVVLPSRSEGLPTVILEAVALGTKVICPPGIPEFERYLPYFALPEVTPTCIYEALQSIWCSESMPQYPYSKHSLHQVTEQLADAYCKVVTRR